MVFDAPSQARLGWRVHPFPLRPAPHRTHTAGGLSAFRSSYRAAAAGVCLCPQKLSCVTPRVNYTSVCVTAGPSPARCLFTSVGDFFGNDAAALDTLTPAEVVARLTGGATVNAAGQAVSPRQVLGGVVSDPATGAIVSATSFRLQG